MKNKIACKINFVLLVVPDLSSASASSSSSTSRTQDMTSRESSEIGIDPTVSGNGNKTNPNLQSDSTISENRNGTHPDTTRKLWETKRQILTRWRWIINREMMVPELHRKSGGSINPSVRTDFSGRLRFGLFYKSG